MRISHISLTLEKCGRTDMRKSIDGLCAVIQDYFPKVPERHALYLFCGRKCDRIKAILKKRTELF